LPVHGSTLASAARHRRATERRRHAMSDRCVAFGERAYHELLTSRAGIEGIDHPRSTLWRACGKVEGGALGCIRHHREPGLSARKALRTTEVSFTPYESRRSARIDRPLTVDDSPLQAMLDAGEIGPGRPSLTPERLSTKAGCRPAASSIPDDYPPPVAAGRRGYRCPALRRRHCRLDKHGLPHPDATLEYWRHSSPYGPRPKTSEPSGPMHESPIGTLGHVVPAGQHR
jgi:hypothetical protein